MLTKNWKIWLGVFVGLLLVGTGLSLLLHFQDMTLASRIVSAVFSLLVNAWVGWGLWVWREVSWVRQLNTIVLTTVGFSVGTALSFAVGWSTGTRTLLYIYLAVMGFMVGMNVLRVALRPSWPVMGVARTMIEEAIRMKVALIFILMLLVLLPVMPLILGSEDRVTYMVQRFLTYSMMVVAATLSVMTVMLGARSVSFELSSKQVYMTLTKPLSRWQYLLGKWIGIGLLNLVLVTVSGVMIYGFTMAIAESPEMNFNDRATLEREILTARLGIEPEPYDLRNPDLTFSGIIYNNLEQKRLTDPDRYGEPGTPTASLPNDIQQEVRAEALTEWLTIKPGEANRKTLRFSGLGEAAAAAQEAQAQVAADLQELGLTADQAKEYLEVLRRERSILSFQTPDDLTPELIEEKVGILRRHTITLVISPDTSPPPDNDMVEIILRLNDVPWPAPPTPTSPPRPMRMAIETPQEITLPASMISSAGELLLTIEVPTQTTAGVNQNPIQLNGKDATVEVFYRTGSFGGNLAKAMLVLWLRLCFLAALGLVAGALLSFPVATLLCLILLIMSVFSGYITEAVNSYASLPKTESTRDLVSAWFDRFGQHVSDGKYWDALKLIIRLVASSILFLVPSISDFSTNPFVSEGRQVPRDLLLDAVWKMGLLWTALVGLIGLALFQRKELAKVVV
ncbi:MAG: ABC transporter permease [Planctomycetota bacterium]